MSVAAKSTAIGICVAILLALQPAGSAEAHHTQDDAEATPVDTSSNPPPYVGVWAKTADACKADKGTQDAPFTFQAKHLQQYETDCKLSGIQNAGAVWTANARCKVQGDQQRHSLVLTVSGDAMELGWDVPKGGDKLVRCK